MDADRGRGYRSFETDTGCAWVRLMVSARAGQGRSGRYLTDGLILYRCIGTVASGMGEMVELEDCRSLELTWLPTGQLRYLRVVIPAPRG
jgi:hypothetical protein